MVESKLRDDGGQQQRCMAAQVIQRKKQRALQQRDDSAAGALLRWWVASKSNQQKCTLRDFLVRVFRVREGQNHRSTPHKAKSKWVALRPTAAPPPPNARRRSEGESSPRRIRTSTLLSLARAASSRFPRVGQTESGRCHHRRRLFRDAGALPPRSITHTHVALRTRAGRGGLIGEANAFRSLTLGGSFRRALRFHHDGGRLPAWHTHTTPHSPSHAPSPTYTPLSTGQQLSANHAGSGGAVRQGVRGLRAGQGRHRAVRGGDEGMCAWVMCRQGGGEGAPAAPCPIIPKHPFRSIRSAGAIGRPSGSSIHSSPTPSHPIPRRPPGRWPASGCPSSSRTSASRTSTCSSCRCCVLSSPFMRVGVCGVGRGVGGGRRDPSSQPAGQRRVMYKIHRPHTE